MGEEGRGERKNKYRDKRLRQKIPVTGDAGERHQALLTCGRLPSTEEAVARMGRKEPCGLSSVSICCEGSTASTHKARAWGCGVSSIGKHDKCVSWLPSYLYSNGLLNGTTV